MDQSKPASKFRADESGNVAMTFGLTLMVTLAFIGGAIDVGRAIALRSALQLSTDAAALNGVTQTQAAASAALTTERVAVLERARQLGATAVTVTGSWRTDNEYVVEASVNLSAAFLSAVPGMPQSLKVVTRSVARGYRMKVVAGPPSKIDLSYEAADYNQVWAYCFDPNWRSAGTRSSDQGTRFGSLGGNLGFATNVATQQNRNGRSDFVLIADNGGSSISFSMPTCKQGESVSYMLYNSRNNRTSPGNWGRNHGSCGTTLSQTGKSCYMWFTDAKQDANGDEQHNGTSPYQLETVLCSDANCNQPLDGAYIPGNNRRHRIPQVARPCEPGKFMYFGWEDRPPQNQGGNGAGAPYAAGVSDPGGDRDYDDIRLIMSCPQLERDTLQVRLIE